MLTDAGISISPAGVITADDLMDRLAALPGVTPTAAYPPPSPAGELSGASHSAMVATDPDPDL